MVEVYPVARSKQLNVPVQNDWPGNLRGHLLLLGGISAFLLLLAYTTLTLTNPLEIRQIIWLPSGVALGATLIFGVRTLPAIALAAFVATMVTTGPLLHGFSTALANTLEIALAVYLLRRTGFDARLERGRDVASLAILGAAIPALITSLLSVATFMSSGLSPDASFGRVWFFWALTHAMGALVVTPVLLTGWIRRRETFEGSIAEGAAFTAVLVLIGTAVFGPLAGGPGSALRIEFAVLPVLLWGAFRFGPLGSALGSFLAAGIAILGTINGYGPFVTGSPNTTLFLTWAYVNICAIPTLLIGAVVTQRRKTQQALSESEERIGMLLDATGDGILVLDPSGSITYANRRFAEMWQMEYVLQSGSPESGTLLAAMSSRVEGRGRFSDMMLGQLDREEPLMDKITLSDGSVFHQYSVPCPERAGLRGRIWSYRDMTATERAEAEKLRLERQMQQAQKLESLGLLAGGVAHDFNNLMLIVLGYTDFCLDMMDEGSVGRGYMAKIGAAAKKAAGLSTQMLAYSGRGTFAVEPVDLAVAVNETAGLMESSISKCAKVVYSCAPDLPSIMADSVQLHQIIMNLVTNASDALGGDEGQIHVSIGMQHCDREYLSSCYVDDELPAGTYVYLEVADTGVGMDEETRARIFDPFFTSKGTGRGLGLAAALGIIRGHNGTVRVTSRPGGGSAFRVLFPATTLHPAPKANTRVEEDQWSARGKILVVDDEDSVRDLARQILERVGFDVVEATDGVDALEVFQRYAGELDLVLLDLTMPRLDGADVLCEMQRMDAQVPVILSSGYTETELAERVDDSAFAGFLKKPYRRSTLVTMTREVLRRNVERSLQQPELTT